LTYTQTSFKLALIKASFSTISIWRTLKPPYT